jgi:hypothetical protein
MLAIQGIYDGKVVVPKGNVPFPGTREVIITFPDSDDNKPPEDIGVKDRLALLESLFGILPSTITDTEIKEARLQRYERNA